MSEALAVAQELLYREGLLLDRKDWDGWLDLYRDDAVYWLPAWRDEYEQTTDPRREISLIYHASRRGLEERVMRIRSRKSITALPLPRTVHLVGNILLLGEERDEIRTSASWTVHVYDPRSARQHVHFGLYEHSLRRADDRWRIARKKIVLMNDQVPTALDFYHI